eukprot:TRINITY_DN7438_c0_g1_i1.p1 TRINITY_DN7438_c0_g1~~TRINITY_DN7438_c0_g1_i1.p1  ORF type:complete len:295 (+),score=91.66 TRINITY_DN7438_c0_g1_i1:134-886(+)
MEGHPWAALCAFDAALAAAALGYDCVATSNERSANHGNGMLWQGQEVNHQYDKSFAFEAAANAYIARHVARGVHYFSALQPLWEVQIAREFARHPQYLPVFISCNEGRLQRWCGTCDKCLFVFCILAAWVDCNELSRCFGRNLLEDMSLLPQLRALMGAEGYKPLECVGEPHEVLLSLWLALERHHDRHGAGAPPPRLLQEMQPFLPADAQEQLERVLRDFNNDHLVPDWLLPSVQRVASLPVSPHAAPR